MVSSRVFMAAATILISVTSTLAEPIARAAASVAPVATSSPVSMGCFSSSDSLTYQDTYGFQTSGYCQNLCVPLNKPVIAINGTDCWCGETMPPASDMVSDSLCDTPCPGFGQATCGSSGGSKSYWTVWNDGLKNTIANAGGSGSNSAASSSVSSSSVAVQTGSSTASASPSVVTVGGQTIVVTASSSATNANTSSSGSSGPNKAGIAAGVVVGIVAIAAIAGGIYLFVRSRRRREVEEEYKRQAAISAFVAGGKPGSSGGLSAHDTRLEPAIMNQRRMSDGSIADNQDYSRRILKVTNA